MSAKKNQTPVTWHDARMDLPDDDLTVLLALANGEVWTGFRDAGVWRYITADLCSEKVLFWAEFPAPPIRVHPCSSVVKKS